MPLIGEKLYLNLQLWDGAVNKYVRAYLYDASNAQVATKDLAHVDRGLYSNSEFTMPLTDEIKAVYKVYSNSSYTVASDLHCDSIDVFKLERETGSSSVCELVGTIEKNTELIGYITDCDALHGSTPC